MKLKLLIAVFLLNSIFSFSQTENLDNTSSKRIKINNPSETVLLKLQEVGIDLRCGAVFQDNSLFVELTSSELKNLNKVKIPYTVEIEDLTKFYSERAALDLPIAKAQLEAEKAKNKLKNSQNISAKGAESISNIILDNQLQYSGVNEVDWVTPANFNLGTMGGCLTVQETLDELDQMRALYPTLISVKADVSPSSQKTWGNTLGTAGNQWPGQTVYYVKISDSPDGADDASEPDILYTSMIHSRELSALMGNIYFMWYLLENYATDPAVKNLVDNNELFFVPIVNPDGLKWNEKIAPGGGGMQRKNLRPNAGDTGTISTNNSLRGVDVNRNFNYLWGSAGSGSSGTPGSDLYRGPSAFSEPESQIMRDFILARNFKIAVWHHSYANGIPHPYGGIPSKVSGRENEMHKWHEDMTRYNRYVSGATIFSAANGIADDWMLGGTLDGNSSVGSGKNILATTPENGHYNERDISNGFSGFWPSATNIVLIVKRMMRINFMNAYYGGKYAKFHDLTQSDVTTLSSNLTFGIERIGQTATDFTLEITPLSSNIQSITSPLPATLAGMTILQQRNVTAALVLKNTITANEKIRYNVKLKNGDGVIFYEANFEKYYTPTVLFTDNPDTDISMANWVESTNWVNSTASFWSGSKAIKAGAAIPYANSIDNTNTLTTTNSYNLSGADQILVQFYSKWDLERNFDFVEILGSTNGTTWVTLNGKYNKPAAPTTSNDSHGAKSTASFQSTNSSGRVYDGDQMDNWVMEEIVIDASNNSFLQNASAAKFRFNFRTDIDNKPENYSANYDGFYVDDFKIIKVSCVNAIVPTNLVASSITNVSVTLNWDNITLVDYDIRYKATSSATWIDVLNISTNNYNLNSLIASTEYEVQVRSKCDIATTSAYTSSMLFTTLNAPPCTGTVFSDFATGYSESFESGLGNWINNTGDNTDWTRDSGGTPSTGTGPTTGSNGTWYLYTEATGFFNSSAQLTSPCFDLTGYKNAKFNFDYHWFGNDIVTASLTLEVSNNNGSTYTPIFTKPLGQASVNSWVSVQNIDLSAYNGETIKLRFTGITGTNFASDMAIDNFSLTAEVDVILGIEDEILNTFLIYPNPVSNGEIKLKMPNDIFEFTITVSNVLGQVVYSEKVKNLFNNTHTVNTENIKKGIYFITVQTDLGKATKKLIIQ